MVAKAKGRTKKGKKKRGPVRKVPKAVSTMVASAVSRLRAAKQKLEKTSPKSRKAWAEMHNCESRLTRLV